MEKRYALCLKVLKRLEKAGILRNLIIAGSWCLYFYKDYFSKVNYTSSIRTRDIDFLVPIPPQFKKKVDLPNLLKDLGFIVDFHSLGFIRLLHPELIIAFLVPERGKGFDKPYPLPQLGLNAQALRFLDFLAENTITVKHEGIFLNLPHPAAFALHKLIVSERRPKKEKELKEKSEAKRVLSALIEKGEKDTSRKLFHSIPKSWQKKILRVLEESEEKEILEVLETKEK